jgi:hypothetical protein
MAATKERVVKAEVNFILGETTEELLFFGAAYLRLLYISGSWYRFTISIMAEVRAMRPTARLTGIGNNQLLGTVSSRLPSICLTNNHICNVSCKSSWG